jgi:hypothetical protein
LAELLAVLPQDRGRRSEPNADSAALVDGRRYQCTMRIDCGQLDPRAVIQPIRGEWQGGFDDGVPTPGFSFCG